MLNSHCEYLAVGKSEDCRQRRRSPPRAGYRSPPMKGQSSMIRRLIATFVGAGLLVGFALVASGCSGDEGQASRESISVPRKGGGIEDPGADPKGKGKGKKAV